MIEFVEWKGKKLYHYTSFRSLESILKTQQIWLGNLRYMNDCMEMVYFFEGIKSTIIKDLPELSEKTEMLFAEQIERFRDRTAYAFCLSTKKDDASQWDRYANGGRVYV